MGKLYLIMAKHSKLVALSILTLSIVLLFVNTAFSSDEALDNVHKSLEVLAGNIRSFAKVICFICAIYIGLMFVLSAINPKLKDNAKGGLWGLVFGVLIILFAKDIAYIITELTGTDIESLSRR